MAIIPGVTVDWRLSPRVATIPATEVSITVEDLQDTFLDLEAQETDGMLFPHLRNTSGGESLGGGVTVGWTMELQNAVTAFAPRTASVSSGTVTTADATGTKLIDGAATFITDGVLPGATIINFTDQSVTSVISIDSETQLTHYVLDDGTDNDWDSADVYKVWNEIQTEITGGNVVAVDGVGSPISPIRPTFGTQVLKTSSSSATLQELTAIQFSSFNDGVTVDLTSSNTGIEFPVGTKQAPVNNFDDALLIIAARGFNKIFVLGNATIDTSGAYDGLIFEGESKTKSTLTISAGASVVGCEFLNATVTGTLDGNSKLEHCLITTLNFVDGIVEDCILSGVITLSGLKIAHFINCNSGIVGVLTPEINMGGSGSGLGMRNYNGGIKLTNKSGVDKVSLDMNSGQVILDSTITGGELVIRGIAKLTNNSSVGANVIDDDLIQPSEIGDLHDEALGKWVVDPTGKTLKLFRKNDTLFRTFNLADTAATIPNFISRTPV